MKVAVTGASGFIGGEVCRLLAERLHKIVPISGVRNFTDDSNNSELLRQQLTGVDAVIHLAARAHVLTDRERDPQMEFGRANVEGTMVIAREAVRAGVRRFVFVSSIGVLGSNSGSARFSESTPPAPAEPYAVSKLEAEAAVAELCSRERMEAVIVRPPLVYGPNVRGNFLRLLRLVRAGVPLPFGHVRNLKSFIGVTNLSELLILCAIDARAAGQVFVAADGEDIALPDLLRRMGEMMHRPCRLFPVPASLLRVVSAALGWRAEVNKLLVSLRVDSTKSRALLGWAPTKDFDTGLEEMVRWYTKAVDRRAH